MKDFDQRRARYPGQNSRWVRQITTKALAPRAVGIVIAGSAFQIIGLLLAASVLIWLQWIHISVEGLGASPARLLIDLVRYLTMAVSVILLYQLWQKTISITSHNEWISDVAESAVALRNSTSPRAAEARAKGVELDEAGVFEHLDLVVRRAASLISQDLSADCRITLKILVEPPPGTVDKSAHVLTLLRDDASRVDLWRGDTVQPFPYTANTAFVAILDEGKAYFGSNDLMLLARHKLYKNLNPQWYKTYNSTLVVPVQSGSKSQDIIGFLCVDSLKAAVDRPVVRNAMTLYSESIHAQFRSLYKLYQADSIMGWRRDARPIAPGDSHIQRKIEETLRRLAAKRNLTEGFRTLLLDVSDVPGAGIVQRQKPPETRMSTLDALAAEQLFDAAIARKREDVEQLQVHSKSTKVGGRRPERRKLETVARYALTPEALTDVERAEVETMMAKDTALAAEVEHLRRHRDFVG